MIDSNISHDKFVAGNNVLKEYADMNMNKTYMNIYADINKNIQNNVVLSFEV